MLAYAKLNRDKESRISVVPRQYVLKSKVSCSTSNTMDFELFIFKKIGILFFQLFCNFVLQEE
jgi:hypothetical protein